jgi:hypothetical protein
MATTESDPLDQDDTPDEKEDPRDAWLALALSDLDGRASTLATAARGGRPLPRRET